MPSAPKKLYIKTYGCQMNVYDSKRMEDVLRPLGYVNGDCAEDADLVILNTCHIREKAEEKVYSDLGRVREARKEKQLKGEPMLVAVGGCVGQAEGAEIMRRAPYVDMVFGPQSYHQLPEMITKAIRGAGGEITLDFSAEAKFDALPPNESEGASAFLAVQEGCDKFCSFCVVPYTRGAEYSRGADAVLEEAKSLVDKGVVELTLLGQNVNAYHGKDAAGNDVSLATLISRLASYSGLQRIRYMTSHPRDMQPDLIALHGSEPKLMPYLHLPVQSGSNAVLKRMNRKHTREHYLEMMLALRRLRPDMAFSGDFIVGFPGETEEDFNDTLRMVQEVGYAAAYSFKYSPRPGTPAATDEKQVPESIKDERLKRLQALIASQALQFNEASIGKTMHVLFEKPGKRAGQWLGKSPYMQSVHVTCDQDLRGQILPVRITGAFANSLGGEIEFFSELRKTA